ncbi:transcriptional regulator PtsJ [Pseudomonas stutzeri]|uniref:MocR-like B6 salvage transcription factor PtsJ n=1 Tax=Stutzerimonas stutzeri TaxID=316 RepID=UPI00210A5244|nr:transcriptional regulator PtsJ [Stutzerimonas stutzeri]MCQ4288369.1 transcriptional regulator PtsJ [Stutzerimonas stutzeri]
MEIISKTAADIFETIRSQVQTHQLNPGQTLPPVRQLASELGVNRNTVAAAYRRLVTAGIAETRGRLGTVICETASPGEQEGRIGHTRLTDLSSGNPNPTWLPDPVLALSQRKSHLRLYGDAPVDPVFQDAAYRWLVDDCPSPPEIDLSHGAVDAVERLLATYLAAGDKVAVESPCFISSINTLRIAGLQAVGIPVDEQGMQAGALADALAKGVLAVLITPRAHNPTGSSVSAERAEELRVVLERYPHVFVLIDDHFALLSDSQFHQVIPSSTRRWALIRSVSKAFGPDLRLAAVGSDRETSQRLRLRLAPGTTWVSHLLQDIAHTCLTSPLFAEQIEHARADYKNRRDVLIDALSAQGIQAQRPCDGLNVWVPLREDVEPIILRLAQRGWVVRSGTGFTVQEPIRGIRITTSMLDADQAARFAEDLGSCF